MVTIQRFRRSTDARVRRRTAEAKKNPGAERGDGVSPRDPLHLDFLGTTRDSSSRPTNGKTTRAHNMSSWIVSETGTQASEVFVGRLIIDTQEQPRVASREPAWMKFEVAISRAAWGAATGQFSSGFPGFQAMRRTPKANKLSQSRVPHHVLSAWMPSRHLLELASG